MYTTPQPAVAATAASAALGVRASLEAAPQAGTPQGAAGSEGSAPAPETAVASTAAGATAPANAAAAPPATTVAAVVTEEAPAATAAAGATGAAAGAVVGEIVQKASRSIQKIADPAVQREVCSTMQELLDTLYGENQQLQAQNEHFRASKSQGLKEALLRYLGVFNSAAQQTRMSADLDRILGNGSQGQVSDELADLLRACCDHGYLTAATAAAAAGRRLTPGNWESDYRLVIRSAAEDAAAAPPTPQPLKAQLQAEQARAAAVLRLPSATAATGLRAAAGTPLARPDVLARNAAPPGTPLVAARHSAPPPEVYRASESLDKYFDGPDQVAAAGGSPDRQWLSLGGGTTERAPKSRRLY